MTKKIDIALTPFSDDGADYDTKIGNMSSGDLLLELAGYDRRDPVKSALAEMEATLLVLSSAWNGSDNWSAEIVSLAMGAVARKALVVGEIHGRMVEALEARVHELEEELAGRAATKKTGAQ